MQNRALQRELQIITELLARTRDAAGNDLWLQSHWGRYVCITVAGFFENALTEVYSDYVRRTANPTTQNYAIKSLTRIQNANTKRFVETASAFRQEWGSELEAFLAIDGRQDAINSIMGQRHLIAHGQDSSITAARVRDYLAKGVEVIEFIETQCAGG